MKTLLMTIAMAAALTSSAASVDLVSAKGVDATAWVELAAPADGAFAVTVGESLRHAIEAAKQADDDYHALLLQSVTDRLAEATSEWLHREVRRHLWGYAPDEDLPLPDLYRAAFRGIRPAVGYPSLPEQRRIFDVARLLRLDEVGIRLTENGAMYPQSSVCGLYLAHPRASYFAV